MQKYTQEEIATLNIELDKIAKQIRKLFDQKQFEAAKQILLEQALALVPHHQIVLSDLAYCERNLNNHEQAYQYLMQALEHNRAIDPEVYDSLVNTCFSLKRFEEARYYAKLSLKRKKEILQANPPEIFPLPAEKAPGLSSDKRKNVICFSLFGSQPRYCETSVFNVEIAKKIYPEWTCRFYLDETVPTQVIERLKRAGAEIIQVTPEQKKISGLFWRFFIFADPTVQCFIIRDADSMLSYKEKSAVDAWIASGKWFHLMRDALEHSELILAGMWGGYNGVFHSIENLSQKFYSELKVINKTIDQHFLRTLYPTVAQSVLIHDNYMLDPDSHLFPDYVLSEIEKVPYFHIGMIDSGINITTFNLKDGAVASKVRWFLKNSQGQEICSYISEVQENEGELEVNLNLPYFYSQQIKQGQMHFSYTILE